MDQLPTPIIKSAKCDTKKCEMWYDKPNIIGNSRKTILGKINLNFQNKMYQ